MTSPGGYQPGEGPPQPPPWTAPSAYPQPGYPQPGYPQQPTAPYPGQHADGYPGQGTGGYHPGYGQPTGGHPGQPTGGYPPYGATGQQWAGPPTGWGPDPGGWAGPPPPPRPDRGRLVALLVIGAIVLAGLGVGTFLLVRTATSGGSGPVASPQATATPVELRTVRTSAFTFDVPLDWQPTTNTNPSVFLGVTFEGVTVAPGYDCGGNNGYSRGIVSSAFVAGERPAASVASTFGQEIGRQYYTTSAGLAPTVTLSGARPVDVGGVEGQLVEATIRAAADDGCLAVGGVILLVAVPTTGPGGAPGTALLVVNGDTEGGPATAPPNPDRAVLDAIVDGARLTGI